MVRGGRREEGSGWGTHVYLWQIHVDIWQKPIQYCKVKKKKDEYELGDNGKAKEGIPVEGTA